MTDTAPRDRYVDTNVILRYLLDDDSVLSPQARVCLDDSGKNLTGIEVVAEAVYVLTGVYGVSRRETSSVLWQLLRDKKWALDHKKSVFRALEIYGRSSLDFIDSWLIALHQIEEITILSFDKKIRRMT